jgi:hypothetical protein
MTLHTHTLRLPPEHSLSSHTRLSGVSTPAPALCCVCRRSRAARPSAKASHS